MRAIRAFLFRLGNLLDKGRTERELAEEFESHLAMQIADNLRAGMSPEQARREALLKSGGLRNFQGKLPRPPRASCSARRFSGTSPTPCAKCGGAPAFRLSWS